MWGLIRQARRLQRALAPCTIMFIAALVGGASPSVAVPWQEQGGQTIVWLTDAELTAARSSNVVRLDPDTLGVGGNCYGPFKILGNAVAHNGVRTTVASCTRSAGARKDCSNLAGGWQNAIPQGRSTWTLRALGGGRYSATESGMGNATGTATLSGTTLTLDFRTGHVTGRYQWALDQQCRAGRGTLLFTAGMQGQFAATIQRQ